jgi:hypothetical protein
MFLKSYRLLRAVVLGLMFFLAVTAPCSANSYDPDPYDDIPPVVSVEFNYLVPSQPSLVRVRGARMQVESSQTALLQAAARFGSAALLSGSEATVNSVFVYDSPHLSLPLRR